MKFISLGIEEWSMTINLADYINHCVNDQLEGLQTKQINTLRGLNLSALIRHKNLFYLITKDTGNAFDIVKCLVDDYLYLQQEIFINEFLKQMVTSVATQVYNTKESTFEGIDVELIKNGIEYFIKIGADPEPVSNIMSRNVIESFKNARHSKSMETPGFPIKMVYGCFYGTDDHLDKGDYLTLCGQRFWEFISSDPDFYLEIIKTISNLSAMKNDAYYVEYSRLLNIFTAEFLRDFCQDGVIDWPKLVKINSGSENV